MPYKDPRDQRWRNRNAKRKPEDRDPVRPSLRDQDDDTPLIEIEARFVARSLRPELTAEEKAAGKTPKEPKESDAPSEEAWSWYLACKSDQQLQREFWRKWYGAQTAKKSTEDDEEKRDDERTHFKVFDDIYRENPQLLQRKQDYDIDRQNNQAAQISVVQALPGASSEPEPEREGASAAAAGQFADVAGITIGGIPADSLAVEIIEP